MSPRPLAAAALPADDYVPQAIVARSTFDLAAPFGAEIVRDHDDLDLYDGVAFALDDDERGAVLPFTIRHYRGHPEGTATIYLPQAIRGSDEIASALQRIAEGLHIAPAEFVWRRGDNTGS